MSEPGRTAVDETAQPAADPSRAALDRYVRSMRKQRTIYLAVVGVVVVALIAWVAVAWSRGEIANTTLHTVAKAPANLAVQAPSRQPKQSWTNDDRAAIGTPQWRGTVVTYSAHRVRGIDTRTGKQTWSYTRSNRTVCTAAQAGGTTIAVYSVNGNCDEVTGLASGTGKRRWTRTLDMDGMPVNGHPVFQVLDSTLLVTTSTVIYALDPVKGFDRWEYTRPGCTIEHAVLGSAGALISQTCKKADCAAQKFCGPGPQLLLRDGLAGHDDKNKTNPDQILWNTFGNTDLPVSADEVISALNTTTRTLDVVTLKDGKASGQVALSPAPSSPGRIVAVGLPDDREIVWIGGVSYSVRTGRDTVVWARRTVGPVAPVDLADPSAREGFSVAGTKGIDAVDQTTGRVTATFAVPAPRAGSRVYPLGTGFLVCGPDGTVAYA